MIVLDCINVGIPFVYVLCIWVIFLTENQHGVKCDKKFVVFMFKC